MAKQTIARLYDSYDDAVQVVNDLEAGGVPHDDVSIVSNDARHADSAVAERHSGAGAGATVGTVLGGGAGLLAGIGALAIPGVGPVVAAGWLIATLAGAGVGAAAGGLLGSLTSAGISEDEAHVYSEGVRRGGTLVTVRYEDADAGRVRAIMDKHQGRAVDWAKRGEEYKQSGWSRFDEAGSPYDRSTVPAGSGTVTQAESDRVRTTGTPLV